MTNPSACLWQASPLAGKEWGGCFWQWLLSVMNIKVYMKHLSRPWERNLSGPMLGGTSKQILPLSFLYS